MYKYITRYNMEGLLVIVGTPELLIYIPLYQKVTIEYHTVDYTVL